MLAVVQRVRSGRVVVDGRVVGAIERGLVVMVGVHRDDVEADAKWLAERLVGLRVFADEAGKMNLSVGQVGGGGGVGGGLLLVPNFTLCAATGKGHRPGFDEAMKPPGARVLFEVVVGTARGLVSTAVPSVPLETGGISEQPARNLWRSDSVSLSGVMHTPTGGWVWPSARTRTLG